ncbi:basic proline-rich protein-like [Cydia amplana]|uniref:basic proline-rich protein-like n=1 Tax=Cydia amplana TaxID=1869771 RepID=UPI002FE6B724
MRVQRALAGGIDRWAGRGAGRPGRASVRVGAASARSSLVQLRRAGVTPRPRAPGGGGEPRAARARAGGEPRAARPRAAGEPLASRPRPRAHAARPPRSRSAPCARPAPRGPRRARSLAPRPPRPRLRPVFLWARQQDGRVQAVHCEDYDPRNRIRLARTPGGWRVIPRTEIYNAIRVPPAPPRERKRGRTARKRAREPAWLAPPDLETHIPSHTIAVPRSAAPAPPPAPPPPPPPEPTPLDNLLAVAELEPA